MAALRQTFLTLAALVFCAACASDAGDFEPGAVCNAAIVHGENEEIIPVGAQRQFDFVYQPCDINDHAPRTIAWRTSDAGVATVTSTGLVTGKVIGTATITASVEAAAQPGAPVDVFLIERGRIWVVWLALSVLGWVSSLAPDCSSDAPPAYWRHGRRQHRISVPIRRCA